jgi:hypothetical protein
VIAVDARRIWWYQLGHNLIALRDDGLFADLDPVEHRQRLIMASNAPISSSHII